MKEKGEAEAPHHDVSGVQFTPKLGLPWDKETDREMPHQFGGGLQELA